MGKSIRDNVSEQEFVAAYDKALPADAPTFKVAAVAVWWFWCCCCCGGGGVAVVVLLLWWWCGGGVVVPLLLWCGDYLPV